VVGEGVQQRQTSYVWMIVIRATVPDFAPLSLPLIELFNYLKDFLLTSIKI